jgi:hypothetical protein
MGQIRWQHFEKDGHTFVEEIHKVVVHRFKLSDVDDPDLYAAEPLWQWQQTEAGQFVMEHAINKPEWHRNNNIIHWGYEYAIVAELEKKKLTEFYLRWGKPNGNN